VPVRKLTCLANQLVLPQAAARDQTEDTLSGWSSSAANSSWGPLVIRNHCWAARITVDHTTHSCWSSGEPNDCVKQASNAEQKRTATPAAAAAEPEERTPSDRKSLCRVHVILKCKRLHKGCCIVLRGNRHKQQQQQIHQKKVCAEST